jgi:hypothetical protein
MSAKAQQSVQIESLAQVFAVLNEAAELEHGVMCGYLYAAFGLKTEPSDGLQPEQTEAVRRWRKTILDIATEEMSHLALVSNLMVALGARPHFGRQNMPVPSGCHPADIRLALAPFDRDMLDHFIYLERPAGSPAAEAPSLAGGPRYVRETSGGRFFPAGSDYETIGELYHALAHGLAKLVGKHKGAFAIDPAAQVGPEIVALPGLITIRSLNDAAQAVENIVRQGEGSPGYNEHSHYGRLIAIRGEYDATVAKDPLFAPSRPIARNPVMRRPPGPSGVVYIDHPDAAPVLDAANAAYNFMLLCLAQVWATAGIAAV